MQSTEHDPAVHIECDSEVERCVGISDLPSFKSFVVNRHRIWEARQVGIPQEGWTSDPILKRLKMTNMFRVLDPGSQFVLTDLAPTGTSPRDTVARLFLYRYTNLPRTWRHMRDVLGHYPTADDLGPDLTMLLQDYRDEGNQIFSGAYVIIPRPQTQGDKIALCVDLARQFMNHFYDDFMAAESQAQRLDVLMRPFGVGQFLAQQILTDVGYTELGASWGDAENQHVVKGPGSKKGAALVDRTAPPESVFRRARAYLGSTVALELPNGRLRPPSLMDVQNQFCESFKFNRAAQQAISGTKRLGAPYRPAHPGAQTRPVYPAHW